MACLPKKILVEVGVKFYKKEKTMKSEPFAPVLEYDYEHPEKAHEFRPQRKGNDRDGLCDSYTCKYCGRNISRAAYIWYHLGLRDGKK